MVYLFLLLSLSSKLLSWLLNKQKERKWRLTLKRGYQNKRAFKPCVPLAIKAIMISFKVSQLDLIALKLNNVKISNNTIMIVLIAKGTQGRLRAFLRIGDWDEKLMAGKSGTHSKALVSLPYNHAITIVKGAG